MATGATSRLKTGNARSAVRMAGLLLAATLLAACHEDKGGGMTGNGQVDAGGGDVIVENPPIDGGTDPGAGGADTGGATPATPTLAELGRALFHERGLSAGGTQSCADCHADASAFSDPDADLPVSAGAVAGHFGTRNTPTAMYTAGIPPLALRNTPAGPRWVGGLFLDGRADTLADQARAPLFNPDEMALVDAAELVAHLRDSATRPLFEALHGADSLAIDADPDTVLAQVAEAIAAFERTPALQPFSAKFDAVQAGTAQFTPQEALGLDLFVRRDKGDCAACHPVNAGPRGEPTVFSNLAYENIGVPRHPDRRFFAADSVDTGLEKTLLAKGIAVTTAATERGKYRVPTLRNVALTAPYMHNGVFADLQTVIDFYNTRDSDPARWRAIGETEVPGTVERLHTGNRRLNATETAALVAFLGTLSDGYVSPE